MSFKEKPMPGNTRLQPTVQAVPRGSTSPHYCKECLSDFIINHNWANLKNIKRLKYSNSSSMARNI